MPCSAFASLGSAFCLAPRSLRSAVPNSDAAHFSEAVTATDLEAAQGFATVTVRLGIIKLGVVECLVPNSGIAPLGEVTTGGSQCWKTQPLKLSL